MLKDRFAKQFWISIAVIFASIIAAAGAIYYFAGDLDVQSAAIVAARDDVQAQTAAVANLASLKSQAPRAAQYEAAIESLIPDQYHLVTFPQWFSRLGTQNNVTASAVLGGSAIPAAGANPGTAPFSFSVEGQPNAVPRFLDLMSFQTTGFLMTINSFDVTMDGGNYKVTGQGTLLTR